MKLVSVPHGDMGSGVDQLSSEDSIPEGYSESLVNFEPAPEGYVSKRQGYQGIFGFLPVRVEEVVANGSSLTFILDSSIDLGAIPSPTHSRPIVVYGRTSTANTSDTGDFLVGTDQGQYYPSFTAAAQLTIQTGTNTLTFPSTYTGLSQPYVWAGLAQSTSSSALDYSVFQPDQIVVNEVTDTLSVTDTNGTGSPFPAFLYTLPMPAALGSVYVSPDEAFAPGTSTVTIPATLHELANSNIQVKCFLDAGGNLTEAVPDAVVVDTLDNVSVTLTNHTAATIQVVLILSAAPIANVLQGSATPDSVVTVQIPVPPNQVFNFISCYLEESIGGPRTEVWPDSIVYSSTLDEISVNFINTQPTAANFFVYWQPARLSANQLTVVANTPTATPYDDKSPQMSLYGLDQSLIYGPTAGPRAGWVTELDTYRSTGEEFLVAGLGGVLFSGQNATPDVATAYLIPSLYPNLRARTAAAYTTGPAFLSSLSSPFRTAGHVVGDNLAPLSQASTITWDSGTGYMRVTVPVVNGVLTSGTAVQTTPGFEDQLTIQSAGAAVQNGTFAVKSFVFTPTLLTFEVANPNLDSSDYDDLSSGAEVGILTDRLTFTSNSPFLPGDVLLSQVIEENQQLAVVASSGTQVLFGGLNALLAFPGGVRVAGSRVSNVIPLRTLNDVPSVVDLVVGDNLQLSTLVRQLRVLSINTQADISVSITGNGALATATLGSGSTASFAAGDSFLLQQAGAWSGVQVVSAILSTSQLTFASSLTGTSTGTLQGQTAQVDESFLWMDDVNSAVTAVVPGRWIALEAPDTSQTETPGPYVSYLNASSYTDQPIVRSCMANDSLFMNNGVDRTLKLDGGNVYRPGIPRWQPELFVALATTGPGSIVIPITSASLISPYWFDNNFVVSLNAVNTFLVGAKIQRQDDLTHTYTVTAILEDTTNNQGVITVDQNVFGVLGAGPYTLQQVVTYSYYFRLNAVDANRNVIASAAAGSVDWTFDISGNTAIRLRLVGLPAWDIYDYDALEVQVYRTKSNGVAPYYLLTTLPMSFDPGGGYIDYSDTAADETLATLDPVNTALKGQELGTGWSHPIRANRVTSASNRLVLANLTSDPFIDITLYNEGGIINATELDGLRWLVRKDESDPLTTSNMANRVGLQWMYTGDAAVTATTFGASSFTVTSAASVAVGDWVYLFRKAAPSTNQRTTLMGWWQVASVGSGTFTCDWSAASILAYVTSAQAISVYGAYTFADSVDRVAVATLPGDVPVWLGVDQGYQFTSGTLGQDGISPAESMAALRLANAINATQRNVDRTLAGYSAFVPWVCCDAGGDFNVGEFILRQVQSATTVYSLTLPSGYSTFNIYADNVLRDPGATVGAVSTLYPSRILVSYTNFPEIFDSPLALVDSQSDSAIDVNPSDGQEITAVIPFYGDSSFGAAMKDSVILVFKTNSIYLINVAQKVAGANPVQRIESMGLGCTAPNSVTPTRTGIMFANDSGIYKLQTDMTMYYMGRHIQRLWRQGVNIPNLDLAFGHNYAFGSQFKLSVPLVGSEVPNTSFVYNSTREYSFQGITNTIQLYATKEGGWNQHTFPETFGAIGWASLLSDSYYASMLGRVFLLRNTNLAQDYRDDDQPIGGAAGATATLRAMAFGDNGVRKSVPYAVISYRNPMVPFTVGTRTGAAILSATDLSQEFTPADLTTLPENAATQGLGDYVEGLITTYRYSFNQKRGVYFQLQITDSTIDEPLDVTQIRYLVAGLEPGKGIREAAAGPAPAQNGGQ